MKIEGRRPEQLGGKFLKQKSLRNAFSCNLEKKSSCNDAYLIYYNKKEWYSGIICLFHGTAIATSKDCCCFRSLFLSCSYKLTSAYKVMKCETDTFCYANCQPGRNSRINEILKFLSPYCWAIDFHPFINFLKSMFAILVK